MDSGAFLPVESRKKGIILGFVVLGFIVGCAGMKKEVLSKKSGWDINAPSANQEQDSMAIRQLGRIGGNWDHASSLAVDGEHVYVATGFSGLRVVNVSDPARAREAGFYDTPGYAWAVAVMGDNAFVADGNAGLRVINISHPARMQEVSHYDTPGAALGVAVKGNYAFVADNSGSLRVIDISNPARPRDVGFYQWPLGNPVNVTTMGEYAFTANEILGLRIVDVSDPINPREVGGLYTPGKTKTVAVTEKNICVADEFGGLRIIDVSDPTKPREVGFYRMSQNPLVWGVAVEGDYAIVTDWDKGIRAVLLVIDISNPLEPRQVGFYRTLKLALGVGVGSDGIIYVAEGKALGIYDASEAMAILK